MGIKQATIYREGNNIVIIYNGQRIMELRWDAALMVSNAIRIKAKQIEEEVNSARIIFDEALATRLGLPIGFSNNPVILKEAEKEAAHNPLLRKYLPVVSNSVRSRGAVGTPALIQHRRKDHA